MRLNRAMRFLYRGVTTGFHDRNGGRLEPKKIEPFEYNFHWEEKGVTWDSGGTWDSTTTNAVIRHQLKQEGFPTSGISTTPLFERAEVYARGGKVDQLDTYTRSIAHCFSSTGFLNLSLRITSRSRASLKTTKSSW